MTMSRKPWLKQPGECYDCRGVPIYPGDLVRCLHFYGPRKKKNWLYHVVVFRDGALHLIPPSRLEPTLTGGGGECLLSDDWARSSEVVAGYGPDRCLHFDDRPKRRKPKTVGGSP